MEMLTDPQTLAKMRQVFKKFNPFMVSLWRLGLGRSLNAWPSVGGRILVIVHRGRKTGLRRLTPVNYAIVDGEVYCTAGFGAVSDWYRNILAHPEVELWLPDSRWMAVAEDVSDHPQRLPLLCEVIIASGFVAPLMGLHPHTISDEDLNALTADYRLVHFRRLHPAAGPDGPGDMAWLWIPFSLLAVAVWLLARQRR